MINTATQLKPNDEPRFQIGLNLLPTLNKMTEKKFKRQAKKQNPGSISNCITAQ